MDKFLNQRAVKWGLAALALTACVFRPELRPFAAGIILIAIHALWSGVAVHPVRLLGAAVLQSSISALRWLQVALPKLDYPELLLVAPFLFGVNMAVGAFLPRGRRLLRPGRLIGLALVWLACYLFLPTPGVLSSCWSKLPWFGWLLLVAGLFGLLSGDYRRPSVGLCDLRRDRYWHGRRLTEQEEAVRQGGREGEQAVREVLTALGRQYTSYHGVHLCSVDRGLPGSQELDHLVVGPNGVFNLETKNWRGKVLIKPSGQWLREGPDGKPEPWESPAKQVERHRQVLLSILRGLEVPIIDCLIMTNPHTVIEGLQHCKLRIIRVQQLQQLIRDWRPRQPLGKELQAEVKRRINESIIPAEQFEAGSRFVWRFWHWLAIDGVAACLFFWLA